MLKKLALILVPALIFILSLVYIPKLGAAGNNLIVNPSVETASGSQPANWNSAKTGTNTTSFNYLNTGHTGIHSLQVQMTKRSSGQAYWTSSPVNIAPSTVYTFSDWYQSNVPSTLVITFTKTTGVTSKFTYSEPASSVWKQATASITSPARAATVTVRQYINRVGQLTTDDYDLEGPAAPTAPTVNLTAPAANAAVSGTQTVSATATDAQGIKNVQFKLDGANLGTTDTTAPYSVSWNTKNTANGQHILTAVATNTSNLTATSSPVTVDVENLTAPTVQITAPAAGATVSGTQNVTANAASAQGVSSVQFKLNGANLGNPVTASPYTISWDTTKTTNATYSLTAVVTDKANLTATSAPVSVTVINQTSGGGTGGNGPNLIANPSFETSANGTSPDSWLSSNWGTNTSAFTYLNTGHTGSHSVKVQTTNWTNGAANWYYNDIPVTAGSTYQYSNWYQSNVDTEVDAEVVMNDGTTSYYYLGGVPASTVWNQFTTSFTAPVGAKSLAIYQILAKVGYIVSDDYSLESYTPATFNRGIVTLDFDDGWLSQYTNAVPALQANGLTASFFIITDSSITNPDPEYMNVSQIINLKNQGYEIGNHTQTHPDLTTLSSAQVQTEMAGAQSALQNAVGVTPTDFAYPFGAYNANTIAIGKQVGFISQRSVNSGFNTKDNLDLTQLKIEEVDANITPAQVQAWVNQAIAQKTWLILVYHEVDTKAPAGSGDDAYVTTPANLQTELAYIKSTGVAVKTTAQAINEILPQL